MSVCLNTSICRSVFAKMGLEQRKYERFKTKDGIKTRIQSSDAPLKSEGYVLNISKGGAYVLARSIPFTAARIVFHLDGDRVIERECLRVDPFTEGAQGMAVQFLEILDNQELEELKDFAYLEAE